jgi:RHS repeat-associated protein
MADIDLLPHAFHRPVRKTDSERRLFSQFDVAAFAGHYTDAESGFPHLRARYYDAPTAQLISPDPAVIATRELYAYAIDSPSNQSDPSGLGFWDAVQSGGIWIGQHLPGQAKQQYINLLKAAGERAGDDYTRLDSGDPWQMVQPVSDAITIAATVTGVWGVARAVVGCGLRLFAADEIPLRTR